MRGDCVDVRPQDSGRSLLSASRTPNPVIKAVVFDAGGLEMPDHFCLFGKKPGYGALGRVNHVMALVYRNMTIDLQMEFYKDSVAGVSRAKIVNGANARTGDCGRFDALALLMWQLVIQKLARCNLCDTPSARNHVASDN